MFERHQTVTQLTRPASGRAGVNGSADQGQRSADPARLRAALAGAGTIRLRERMDRRRLAARVA